MTKVEIDESDDKVRVVTVFDYEMVSENSDFDAIQHITSALNRANITPDDVRSVDYPESNTKLGIISLNRRSILANKVDELRDYMITVSGYSATYITTDKPEEQPDIKSHMTRIEKM